MTRDKTKGDLSLSLTVSHECMHERICIVLTMNKETDYLLVY